MAADVASVSTQASQSNPATRTSCGGERGNLDGSWSFEAQFRALGSNAAPDNELAFKEKSVKDITDRGRAEGAARLQEALEQALEALPPLPPPPMRAAPREADSTEELELQRDVRNLMRRLGSMREAGNSVARNTAAMEILLQLRKMHITVACLKATKVAAEVNSPCWRGEKVSAEVRELAGSLAKAWRAKYRSEVAPKGVLTMESLARKCRNLSMDLEDHAHGHFQKAGQYMELVEALCQIICSDSERTRNLFAGLLAAKGLVAVVADAMRRRQERRQRR